jgi:hypothetical protein
MVNQCFQVPVVCLERTSASPSEMVDLAQMKVGQKQHPLAVPIDSLLRKQLKLFTKYLCPHICPI